MLGKEVGAYRILEKIGQGGMGVVYKGIHVQLEQEVAIKVLSSTYASEPVMRQRFIQEAKIQARLTHPHVVNILNYLEEGEDIFLVMEYVRGDTLEQRLKNVGSCATDEAVSICQGVLSALSFMHIKGIVHRDIKPGNIMFTDTGLVKVTDFGIAKVAGEEGQTKTGMLLGTLGYVSPEQIQGQAASVTSDLYALGMTLYRMVTGKLPFDGDSEYTIMQGHIETIPTPPWNINPHIPQDLGRVILQAIEKAPERRYQNAAAFAQALTGLARQPGMPHVERPKQPPPLSSTPRTILLNPQQYLTRRSPWRYLTLSSGTLVLAALLYVAIAGNPIAFTPSTPVPVQPVPPVAPAAVPASMPPVLPPAAEHVPHLVPTGAPEIAVLLPEAGPREDVTVQEPATADSAPERPTVEAIAIHVPRRVEEPPVSPLPVPSASATLPALPVADTQPTLKREPGLPAKAPKVAIPPHTGPQAKGQPLTAGKEKPRQQRSAPPPKQATRDSGAWYIKK